MSLDIPAGAPVHSFNLTDADGGTHAYIVAEHPGGEGMAIAFELLSLGLPTVLRLAGAAMESDTFLATAVRAVSGTSLQAGSEGDTLAELRSMLSGIDFGQAAEDVRVALGSGQAPALVRRILSRTYRDGKPLSSDASFDLAYTRNYMELLKAVWQVARINRFFPELSMSASGSGGSPKKEPPQAGESAQPGASPAPQPASA